jgi:hypothetical protein
LTEQILYPKCNRMHHFASLFFHGFIILYLNFWLHRFYIQNAAECTILRPSEKKFWEGVRANPLRPPSTAFSLSRVGMYAEESRFHFSISILVYLSASYIINLYIKYILIAAFFENGLNIFYYWFKQFSENCLYIFYNWFQQFSENGLIIRLILIE